MESKRKSVACCGLWEGAVCAMESGPLTGLKIQVMTGSMKPDVRLAALSPIYGPHGDFEERKRLTSEHDVPFLRMQVSVVIKVLEMPGKLTPGVLAKTQTLGIVRGSRLTLATLALIANKTNFNTENLTIQETKAASMFAGQIYMPLELKWSSCTTPVTLAKSSDGIWAVAFPKSADSPLEKYIMETIGLIGCQVDYVVEAYEIFSKLPVQYVDEVLESIVRMRPKYVVIRPGAAMEVDALHAVLAAIIIYGQVRPFRQNGTLSGTAIYCLLAGGQINTYRHPCPEIYGAGAFLWLDDNLWTMPAEMLASCIKYNRVLAGEARGDVRIFPYSTALCQSIQAGTIEPGKNYTTLHSLDCEIPVFQLVFDPYSFFNAREIRHQEFYDTMLKLMTCTDPRKHTLSDPYTMSQLANWLMVTQQPKILPQTASGSSKTFRYKIGTGWISSMIGMKEFNVFGRPVLASMNLFSLHGQPLVIRKAEVGSSDLSEEEKLEGARQFMEGFRKGYKLSHQPKSIKEFDQAVKIQLTSTGGRVFKINSAGEMAAGQVPFEFTDGIEVTRTYFERGPEDPGQDWACTVYLGDTVASNADQIISEMISKLSPDELRRAEILIRHYNSKIVFSISPTIYEEDRAIFRILCAMTVVYTPIIRREKYTFHIIDGPSYWCIIQQHLPRALPNHYEWNIKSICQLVESDGYTTKLIDEAGNIISISGFHMPQYINYKCIYLSECCECCDALPEMRLTCGHVVMCYNCATTKGLPSRCPECGGPGGEAQKVHESQTFAYDPRTGSVYPSRQVKMFSWQKLVYSRLCSFSQRCEVVWLPPGAGKTEPILRYIHFCNTSKCMTKYVLWVTTKSAFLNLKTQAERSGLTVRFLGCNEVPEPGVLCVTSITTMSRCNLKAYAPILKDLTFVLDEFHNCMAGESKKAAQCLEIAKGAMRTIPMSGTIYRNRSTPGELADFLGLCVDFEVTAHNYQTALGLVISYKVPQFSIVRDECIRIPGSSNPDPAVAAKEDAMLANQKILEMVEHSVLNEEIGCVIAAEPNDFHRWLVILKEKGLRVDYVYPTNAPVQNHFGSGSDPTRSGASGKSRIVDYEPTHYPDPRGPGRVALSREQYRDQTFFDESVEANPSINVPQVIVALFQLGMCEGYNLNRYNRMFFGVTESSETTRTQMRGRISRANNDAKFIEYITVVAPSFERLHERHEKERAISESIRDIAQGSDASRLKYEEGQKRSVAEAEAAKARATETANAQYSNDPRLRDVLAACNFFGIAYVPLKSSLMSAAKLARRNLMIEWSEERWSLGSPDQIKYASNMRALVEVYYGAIRESRIIH